MRLDNESGHKVITFFVKIMDCLRFCQSCPMPKSILAMLGALPAFWQKLVTPCFKLELVLYQVAIKIILTARVHSVTYSTHPRAK